MSLKYFSTPQEFTDYLATLAGNCDQECIGDEKNGLNLSNNVQPIMVHPCMDPIPVTIMDYDPNDCIDREIACASTDGRLLSVCLMGDGTTQITELDGSSIADGATAVKCDVDYESVQVCRQKPDGTQVTRITWFDITDLTTVVATVWIDNTGTVIPEPAGHGPCLEPNVLPYYDYVEYTYVAAGNGVGEIETIVFRDGGSGGTIVRTETYAYDANNKVISKTIS